MSLLSKKLQKIVENAEFHQLVVGDYKGAYSLGVTEIDKIPAILLRVETTEDEFPEAVDFNELTIPIIVQKDFVPPKPL